MFGWLILRLILEFSSFLLIISAFFLCIQTKVIKKLVFDLRHIPTTYTNLLSPITLLFYKLNYSIANTSQICSYSRKVLELIYDLEPILASYTNFESSIHMASLPFVYI